MNAFFDYQSPSLVDAQARYDVPGEIVALSDGTYYVTWSSENVGGGYTAFMQRYTATGEAIASAVSIGPVGYGGTKGAVLADGSFVVAWTTGDVHVQRFAADGTRLGAEQVLDTTDVTFTKLGIAGLTNGNFVVGWSSDDSAIQGTFAQIFDATGSAVGGEIQLSVSSTFIGNHLVATADGGFISAAGLWAQFAVREFDAAGAPVTPGFQFSIDNFYFPVDFAVLADKSYLFVATQMGDDGDGDGVYYSRIAADGTVMTAPTLVNETVDGDQYGPKVVALADGSFVIAWNNGNRYINIKHYAADETVLAAETDVASGLATVAAPQIEALSGGGFAVAWSRYLYMTQYDVYQRTFAPDSDGVQQVYGDAIPNTLKGNATAPAHAFFGGASHDTYYVGNVADTVSELDGSGNDAGGYDTVITSVDFTHPLYVEAFKLARAGITGLGNGEGNFMWGQEGANTLFGLGGADYLSGEGGDDSLIGGEGDDDLHGGSGADVLWGETGRDDLIGGAGDDVVYGQAGFDTLYGEDGADHLYGGGDGDILIAGFGDDRAFGEDGRDNLFGEAGDDVLVGGQGVDTLYGQDGSDVLFGEGDDDFTYGGAGHDRLYGQAGDDMLQGEAGNDVVDGGDGADFLIGGAGADDLTGGAGADVFYFDGRAELADRVHDFSHADADRLVFEGAAFNIPAGFTLTAGVGLLQGAGVVPVAQTATFYFDTATRALWYDVDGTGAGGANVIAFLMNTPVLDVSDFVFV